MVARIRWPDTRFAPACLALLVGCAPPVTSAAPEIVVSPAVSTSSPAPPPAPMSVQISPMPARLAIDGDLGEWGPARDGAPVQVAFANEGAVLAAAVGAEAMGGIWVGIGSEPQPVRPNGHTCTSPPATPEGEAACEAQARDFEAFTAEHRRSFVRLFRVESSGVRVMGDGGALVSVPQARVAWKPIGAGATAEVSIPAAWLPRFEETPLKRVRIVVSAVSTPPPVEPERWNDRDLPAPLAFEPGAALRGELFSLLAGRQCDDTFSYQPGDPFRVFGAWSGPQPLYEKQASLGDVEVGFMLKGTQECIMAGMNGPPGKKTAVLVLRAGKPVSALDVGEVKRIVARDGELHLITFSSGYSDGEGWSFADWAVFAVRRDGTVSDNLVKDPDKPILPPQPDRRWDRNEGIFANDLSTFGRRGVLLSDPADPRSKKRGGEIVWRWDPKVKRYVAKERFFPMP